MATAPVPASTTASPKLTRTMRTTAVTRPLHHLRRLSDLSPREFAALLDLAAVMKRHPLAWRTALEGQTVACHFAKPSTRTGVSFETPVARLGGTPLGLRPDELQLGRGEPIADTA